MGNLTLYKEIQSEIQSGDMLEFGGTAGLAKIIQWRTGYDVNHSALCIKLKDYKEWKDEPRRFVLEAVAGGIDLNIISEELEKFDGHCYYYKLKSKYDYLRESIEAEALELVSRKYNYKGLVKNILGRTSVSLNNLFCSEYVYVVLNKVGIIQDSKAPVPGGLTKYNIFEDRLKLF